MLTAGGTISAQMSLIQALRVGFWGTLPLATVDKLNTTGGYRIPLLGMVYHWVPLLTMENDQS
jgi:hypothetical protein